MPYKLFGPRDAENQKWSAWAAERIEGCERGWRECSTARLYEGDETLAVMVFHGWNPEAGTMCISGACERPLLSGRSYLRAAHQYVFGDAGCQMAMMQTRTENRRMNRLASGLGYTPYRIPRLLGPVSDGIIWTLTAEAWRSSRLGRGLHGFSEA